MLSTMDMRDKATVETYDRAEVLRMDGWRMVDAGRHAEGAYLLSEAARLYRRCGAMGGYRMAKLEARSANAAARGMRGGPTTGPDS